MADDEVGYYQILDNYTIWRLETVADVHRVHQTPMRTLSFPSSPFLRAEIKPSFQLHHEVPLHKKRNLAKNLRAMIEDLQQKAERIEAEVSGKKMLRIWWKDCLMNEVKQEISRAMYELM